MKVLMISLERALLGEKTSTGDAIERHRRYGEFVDELNIIVMCKRGYEKQQLSDNVFVWPTNSANKVHYVNDAFKIAEQIYHDNPFNLVVCQDPFLTGFAGLKLKKKFGVKLLVHFHGDFWQNKNWLKEKWYNWLLLILSKKVVRGADGIRVTSSGIKNKLVRTGVKKEKIRVIPTPVDLSKFLSFDVNRVEELKQKYSKILTDFSQGSDFTQGQGKNETSPKGGMKGTGKIILFVGRLEPEKNLSWFLKVFKEIKQEYNNVQFLMVGEGSEKNNLKFKIEKLALSGACPELAEWAEGLKLDEGVKLIGHVSHDDLTNYYHLSDIVVLPSTSESFGKVLVEAGAAGIPCVATATTGARDIIIDGKTGFLLPINNQKKMKEKILLLLRDEDLKEKMGQAAQEYVRENFDGEVQIEKIGQLWHEMVLK